jgi:4-amino-4-deoxy-L-arabinose transferase-like glycosyltransferase
MRTSPDETITPRFWPDMAALLALALVVRAATALPLRVPGYMDAYYYYVGAERIVAGYGLTEPYIWNYWLEPLRLPAPAFQYWLPLTSFIMVPFLALLGPSFRAAHVPFVLLSALLPLIAYRVSFILAPARRRAILAGLLTIFTPFYMKYWVSTDNFTPFALCAGLALLTMRRAVERQDLRWYAAAGALVGLGHLARADAPLLLAVLALAGLWPAGAAESLRRRWKPSLAGLALAVAAYGLVLLPWLMHNISAMGAPFNPVGARTIFLRDYDDLYSYGRPIDLASYLAWGWPAILRSKLDAAGANLITVTVVFLLLFMAPLAAWEMWARRRETLTRLVGWYLLLLYLTMTLIFTFPGPRGSLLHSGGALLPFLLAYAAGGLERAIAWAARRRATWDVTRACRVFGAGSLLIAVIASAFVYARAVWAGGDSQQAWNTHDDGYRIVDAWLDAQGAPADAPIMVVNPPAFYYFARRPAIAIPNEPPETIAAVCARFGAGYLLLEANRPRPLDALFAGAAPPAGRPTLELVKAWHAPEPEVKLYRCLP